MSAPIDAHASTPPSFAARCTSGSRRAVLSSCRRAASRWRTGDTAMAAVDASSDCQLWAFTSEGGYDLSIVGLLREFEPEPGVDEPQATAEPQAQATEVQP